MRHPPLTVIRGILNLLHATTDPYLLSRLRMAAFDTWTRPLSRVLARPEGPAIRDVSARFQVTQHRRVTRD